ncbi:MAG: tRNA (adenosine(37)-N6)-threonylcarbamoyltransferase complex dimerization subunit type 1 TsaB, partial [Spirochaeta sp. LUC14_002_19_P3]
MPVNNLTVLGMECSGRIVSIALSSHGSFWEISMEAGSRHSEILMPMVAFLLESAGITPKEIHIAACAAGPGTFTGLRIGMAAVKGIVRGTNCIFKTVPTLPLLAAGREHWPGLVVPIMDARKQRVYAAAFQNGKQIIDDCDIALDDFFRSLPSGQKILVTGPDAKRAEGRENITIDPLFHSSRGRPLVEMAAALFETCGEDSREVGPTYLRLS